MKKVVIIILIALLAFTGYVLRGAYIKGHTIVYDGPCTFDSWEGNSERIFLNLNCGGKKATTYDATVILSYLKNPGVITCKVNAFNMAICPPKSIGK